MRRPIRTVQTQWTAEAQFNREHPLAHLCVEAFDPATNYSLLRRGFGTLTGTPLPRSKGPERLRGFNTTFGTGTTDAVNTTAMPFSLATPHTVLVRALWNSRGSGSGSSWGRLFIFASLSDLYDNGSNVIRYDHLSSTTTYRFDFGTWPTGQVFTLAIAIGDVATQDPVLYIDGVRRVATRVQGSGTPNSLSTPALWLGQRAAGGKCWDGLVGRAWVFKAALSPEYLEDLTTNPWQLDAPRRIWVPVSASGVSGTFSVTLGNDVISSSGTTTVSGTLGITLNNDTLNSSGTTTILGTSIVTLGNDVLSASGTTTVVGTSTVTLGNDTLTASGTVGGSIEGTFAVTLGNDTLSASGTTTITGSFTKTLGNDALSASGTTTVTGTVNVTLGNDVINSSGTTAILGTLGVTLNNDLLSANGTTTIIGTFSKTLENDTLSATGTTTVLGTTAVTLGNDIMNATGTVGSGTTISSRLALTFAGQ